MSVWVIRLKLIERNRWQYLTAEGRVVNLRRWAGGSTDKEAMEQLAGEIRTNPFVEAAEVVAL